MHWLTQHGSNHCLATGRLLLLCDGGGSHLPRRQVFKEALQHSADRLELEILIAHYPPCCSRHSLVEHWPFADKTRSCQGMTFPSVAIARKFMAMVKTTTGLKVTVDVPSGV